LLRSSYSIAPKQFPDCSEAIFFVSEAIFFVSEAIFFVSEAIFFVFGAIFFVSEAIIFVFGAIFFVFGAIFFVSEAIIFVSEAIDQLLRSNRSTAPKQSINCSEAAHKLPKAAEKPEKTAKMKN
jgi:hypothetical protein